MSLAQSLASHGLHLVDSLGEYLVSVPAALEVPTDLDGIDRFMFPYAEASIDGDHGVTFYNTDQALTDLTFSLSDFPSVEAFADELRDVILRLNYYSLPADVQEFIDAEC